MAMSLCATHSAAQNLPHTQIIPLEAGWNLIAVQVEPTNPVPENVFSIAGLKSAWAFDAGSQSWRSYHSPAFDPKAADANNLPGLGIDRVSMGQAFWIEMNIAGSLRISGNKPAVAPEVALQKGWNLVGIPVAGPEGNSSLTEQIPIVAALALKGLDYDMLLKWQEGASVPDGTDSETINFNRSQFGTTLEGTKNEEQFRYFEPNRGYWIRITEPMALRPQLLTTVRGETDLPPTGNFPNGPEDVVLQGGPLPITANEQNTIKFFPDEDVQRLSFSNEGGGVMLWEAFWSSSDSVLADAVSLSYSQSAKDGTTSLSGVTTTETETIFLRLDRRNMSKSSSPYEGGKLILRTSAGDVTFDVSAAVDGLKGEWSGFAEISSVNGKRNPIPDIDLNLSFFEDVGTAGLLRGAIDRSKSVLWPVDVQLIGHITAAKGNSFQLGGAFVLPPGDQNNEPFDRWDASVNGQDIDWNDDGYNPADRVNPLPFPIYRSVSLDGQLVSANSIDDQGHVVVGSYREVIYGMMKDPILLEGTFTLSRESPVPFDSLRENVVSGGGGIASPIATGPIPARRVIPNGSSLPAIPAIEINADLVLEEVRVSFDLRAASSGVELPTTNISISLEAPDGKSLVLHDGSAIDPASLIGASYPNRLIPLGTAPRYEEFVPSVSLTRGNWLLHVTNNAGTGIAVSNVRIILVGQPVVDIHGKVLDASGQPVRGADISLNGLPISQSSPSLTGDDGTFLLRGVPAMPVNLAAFHPAYTEGSSIIASQLIPKFSGNVAANAAEIRAAGRFADRPLPAVPPGELAVPGFGSSGSAETFPFEIRMQPLQGPVAIVASLDYGVAPLEVDFFAARANTGAAINWDFGDGSRATGIGATHSFLNPGVYRVSLSHSGGTLSKDIVVLPSPGHTPVKPSTVPDPTGGSAKYAAAGDYKAFIFQPSFYGGGSLPAKFPSPSLVAPQDYPNAAPAADLVMLQHAYAASADIDLAPFTAGPGSAYASDTFQSGPSYWASSLNNQPLPGNGLTGIPAEGVGVPFNDPGWTFEDHNYVLWGGKWFDDANLDGKLNPGEDDIAGLTGYKYDSASDNDGNYESPRSTGLPGPSLNYYRMACSIGAPISPVGIIGASVRSADADPVTSPPLVEGSATAGIASNLAYRLSTNLLGTPAQ
ncbi:MAG: PKD domain-containing protein [Verrucomicrobiales bacterium]